MNYTQEKIFFGSAAWLASAASTMGAIISTGELRWIFVTLTVSIITSTCLALIFKRADETIRLVVVRSGMAILSGVFGSKYLVHHYSITTADSNIVDLGAIACVCCIVGFILGFILLQTLNTNANRIVETVFKKWFP